MVDAEDTCSRKLFTEDMGCYEAISDADREMSFLAAQEFEAGEFKQCMNVLTTLHSKRPQDTKVYHNCFVAAYYATGCRNTKKFIKIMDEVCKQAHVDVQNLELLEDVDMCVALYNKAVVLYHLHQYHKAISILDKVLQYVEPLEDNLAQNICFLLLELYLCVYQPKKALYIIGYIETILFGSNKTSGGKPSQKEKDSNQKEESSDSSISESIKRRLQLWKARSYAMLKTSKACKKEIKSLMSSGSSVQNIAAFYLKSQLEYQRGNYRKAMKLLSSVTLPSNLSDYFKQTGDYLPAFFYNNVACIHFYMGKPHLGQFYTRKAIKEFEDEIKCVTDKTDVKLNVRPIHLMNVSTLHQLTYNFGMQLLQGQQYQHAFDCLVEVVRSYHSNPRLWLRIAECCIQIHKPDNTAQFVECKRKMFVKNVVSAGPHRKLILNSSVFGENQPNSLSSNGEVAPTLSFAMLCLKNGLALLPENKGSNSTSDTNLNLHGPNENSDNTDEANVLQTLPSNYIQNSEVSSFRNSLLTASSYVALCLGDIILALKYANMLLSQPRISGAHKFLAHLYAGEALLIMDKISESVDHFNFPHNGDIELAYPANSSEVSLKHQLRLDSKSEKNDDGSRPVGNIPNWFPNTISTAKFISLYNLTVAYALREEWDKATDCILKMNPNGDVPEQALPLLTYIQFHQGLTDQAIANVKKCMPMNQ